MILPAESAAGFTFLLMMAHGDASSLEQSERATPIRARPKSIPSKTPFGGTALRLIDATMPTRGGNPPFCFPDKTGYAVRILVLKLIELRKRLLKRKPLAVQKTEDPLESSSPLLVIPVSFEPDRIEADHPSGNSLCSAKGRYILADEGRSANHGELPDVGMLVHRNITRNEGSFTDNHMPRQKSRIGHGDMIPNDRIMPDMTAGHHVYMISDDGPAAIP